MYYLYDRLTVLFKYMQLFFCNCECR